MPSSDARRQVTMPVIVGSLVAVLAVLAFLVMLNWPNASPTVVASSLAQQQREARTANPRFQPAGNLTVWWDSYPPATRTSQLVDSGRSNIHPNDYVGAESCRECHSEKYDAWSGHSHRWMNAFANESTVRGDFSGEKSISYLGGKGTFFRVDGGYRMQLERGSSRRLYQIHQTIGSRFFQYYVGKLLEGPEPDGHRTYTTDHVLPFGYWLDRKEWVPVVHVGFDELPDGRRDDPFALEEARRSFSPYYQCNSCHTTFPLGDQMMRHFWVLGRHAPFPLHFAMYDYVAETHPELVGGIEHPADLSDQQLESLFYQVGHWEAPEKAVNLGISCEACHLGAKAHAEQEMERPSFLPHSPHLHTQQTNLQSGRTHENVNWACGRCHAGHRPYYAGGMATWNSTEYTDAMKGSCYSELRCIDCHDPHVGIGSTWQRSEAENDASCLKCHQQFAADAALSAHTHHPVESTGSRCMNCHMPRINEGMQDVVRTHTIFSPTKAEMIEANQPNACGLCHTDQPIDWALKYLQEWYGRTYDGGHIQASYPRRSESMAVGWLKHPSEAVRLTATDAVSRQQDWQALPALINVLDDPFLLNRQFARIALEKWLEVPLARYGYRFYMTPAERQRPLERLRRALPALTPSESSSGD